MPAGLRLRAKAQEDFCWRVIEILFYRAVVFDLCYAILYPDGALNNFVRYTHELNAHFDLTPLCYTPFSKKYSIGNSQLDGMYSNVCENFENCFVKIVAIQSHIIEYFRINGQLEITPAYRFSINDKLGGGVVVINPPPASRAEMLFLPPSYPSNSVSVITNQAILMRGVVAIKTLWKKNI